MGSEVKTTKVKATDDRGSLDLTKQIDNLNVEVVELKKIIDTLQTNNKKLREQIKKLKAEADDLLLYP